MIFVKKGYAKFRIGLRSVERLNSENGIKESVSVSSGKGLIESVSKVEKSLVALDFNLHSILVYNSAGEFVLHASFQKDLIDPKVIGGLVVAINEFSGRPAKRTVRTILMKNMTLKFTTEDDILFVFVIKEDIPSDEKIVPLINHMMDAFHISFQEEAQTERSENDLIATSLVKIILLLSEKFQPSIQLGEKQELEMDLIFYEADKKISELLSKFYVSEEPFGGDVEAEETPIEPIEEKVEEMAVDKFEESTKQMMEEADLNEELDEAAVSSDSLIFQSAQTDPLEAVQLMVRKLNQSFRDIVLTTVVAALPDGSIQTISEGSLPDHILRKLNNTVLELLPAIFTIWDKPPEERSIELDDNWAFFQKISDESFLYVITKTKDTLDLIQTVVDRMAYSIASILPSETP